jgi:hypothetical protein
VLVLAVVAKAFSVVRRGDDQRRVPQPGTVEPLEEPPHLSVGVSHLSVVRTLREALAPGGGRLVGVVGIEDVDPEKEAT